MKFRSHAMLPIVMLLSAPVLAADSAGQGAAKPPAELRLLNSLNMSGSLSPNTNTATAATAATPIVVDKVEVYVAPSGQAPAQ